MNLMSSKEKEKDLRKYKENANRVLLESYDKHGYDYMLELAKYLVEQQNEAAKKYDGEGQGTVLGELCETVLECKIKDYIKKNNLTDWFYVKGFYMRDIETQNTDFLTEIDLVLFTPEKIIIWECKSYKGDKIIVGQGDLKRIGRPGMNVFEQQKLHGDVFLKTFNVFRDKGKDEVPRRDCFQLAVFSFAEGTLTDKRKPEHKLVMPFLEEPDLDGFLDKGRKGKKTWNMVNVRRAADFIVSKGKTNNYGDKHLDFVKSARHKREMDSRS